MSSKKLGGGAPKCPTCEKSVYFNEQVIVLNKAWHKRCLKCSTCGKVLDAKDLNDRDNKVYCNPCYHAAAGIKGFGYGAGMESHTSGGAAGAKPDDEKTRVEVDTSSVATGLSGGFAGNTATQFCSNCGEKSTGGNFCGKCGTPVKK